MAKNKSRRNNQGNPAKQNTATTLKDDMNEGEVLGAGEAASCAKSSKATAKPKEILYQVVSKRDSDVLKAYITFTYRVLHPNVTMRLMIYGLIILLPGIFYFKDLFWRIFFIAIGAALILLGLFRQYISLAMTKRNDSDYKSGAKFTYNFTASDAEFLREGERFSVLDRYKDITNFYYDDDFYYLGIKSREFFVIPKTAFTIGDAAGFEEFIYKKSKHTCRWIPNNFRDRMKKRRAERAVSSGRLTGK